MKSSFSCRACDSQVCDGLVSPPYDNCESQELVLTGFPCCLLILSSRFFWLGLFLTFIYTSWSVVSVTYLEGASEAFSLEINSQSTPIWDIPFPAVLVCSAYPIRKSVFDIEKEVNEKYKHFSKMVCPNKQSFNLGPSNVTFDQEYFEFIFKAAIPCEDLIVNCYWHGKKRDCCALFSPVITDKGLCFVFNDLPKAVKYRNYSPPPEVDVTEDGDYLFWNIEQGYPPREGKQMKLVRPFWSVNKGPESGLHFDLMEFKEESQEICSGSLSGFQVAVFSPDGNFEADTLVRIPYNEHSFIKLNPSLVHADHNLRSIDVSKRDCVYKDEIKLAYYNKYGQHACQIECFVQKALRLCGCVPPSAHKYVGVHNYTYCNNAKTDCLTKTLDHLIEAPLDKEDREANPKNKCMCPPDCSWVGYDFTTSFQRIITANTLPPWAEEYNESLEENIARVTIYFTVSQFNTIERKRISSLGDFLGKCGGLLGLFLGFSFMSLFEVVYFAFIRPLNRFITLHIRGTKSEPIPSSK